jgi:hypothetical protein
MSEYLGNGIDPKLLDHGYTDRKNGSASMKKLLISLAILIVFGGTAFYFGWIQILLPAGTYAVIHTKTGGYDERITPAGVFAWRAERLLPTNMTILVFDVEPVRVRTSPITGTLPSSEVYAEAMEGNPSFRYELSLTATLQVKPDQLIRLVKDEGVTPDTLQSWYEEKADNLAQDFLAYLESRPNLLYQSRDLERFIGDIELESKYSSLDIKRLAPFKLTLPDWDLYQASKERYLSITKAQQLKDVESINQEKRNLKVLRDYGELLEEYPVLLQFLYLLEGEGSGIEIFDWDLPLGQDEEPVE